MRPETRPTPFSLVPAHAGAPLADARALFLEYAASLGFSLCFQGFDRELAELPGDYAPPRNRLWVAAVGSQAAGCVALHAVDDDAAEMKRLYVRPAHRGLGLGRALAEAAVSAARELGYARLLLDTVPSSMRAAVAMYQAMGFREVPPYRENPIAGARYLELKLR